MTAPPPGAPRPADAAGDAATRAAPPRVADPDPAWPVTARWPVWPGRAAATRWRIVWTNGCSAAQARWIARYGVLDAAAALIPRSHLDNHTFQLLTHRPESVMHPALILHHFPEPRAGSDAATWGPTVGRAGFLYYIAHAPLAPLLTVLPHLLADVRLVTDDLLPAWDRLARDLPRSVPDAPAGNTPAIPPHLDPRPTTVQMSLRNLAAHPACPVTLLPAVAALALDPRFAPRNALGEGAQAALEVLRLGARVSGAAVRQLAPESLAPLLARAPAHWRTILLTEVLPLLGSGPAPDVPPGRPSTSPPR